MSVLRGMARSRGLKINEYGAFRDDEQIAGRTEEEVYATLGLPWFPPELREARQEFVWAAAGQLPELIELSDIRGDLHCHTEWSDGIATIEEMAHAAKARGLKYLAVTDHSKRATIANGLDAARLRRQWSEIDKLNAKLKGITILKGARGRYPRALEDWTSTTSCSPRRTGLSQVSTLGRNSRASRSRGG